MSLISMNSTNIHPAVQTIHIDKFLTPLFPHFLQSYQNQLTLKLPHPLDFNSKGDLNSISSLQLDYLC